MKNINLNLAVILCSLHLVCIPSLALASTPKLPESETSFEVPSEDDKYKYYIGVSDGSVTIKEGLSEAFDQAVQEAVRENFGFYTQIQTDSYTTEKENQILRRLKQQSGEVSLNGFEKIDSKANKDEKSGRYSIRVLYRYSKSAIAAEIKRIKNGPAKAIPDFSKAGLIDNQDLGGIQVITDPPQASIYLNDEPYLRSPIQIINQIQPGKYKLKIDHPYFETVVQDIIIRANETTKIDKTLMPAKGYFSLETVPAGASVKVDGVFVGKSPIHRYTIFAGKPVRIDVEHIDSFPMSLHSFVVDKDQHRDEKLDLKMKPGSLILSSLPPDAEVYLNSEFQPYKKRSFRLPAGQHRLVVRANGFNPFKKTIDVKANRTLAETIDLQKEGEKPHTEPSPSPVNWENSFLFNKDNYYLTTSGSIDFFTSPVTEQVSVGLDSSAGSSSGMVTGAILQVGFGFKNGLGLTYSVGTVLDLAGSSQKTGSYITSGNRSRIGIVFNFNSNDNDSFQLSTEEENFDAEVTSYSDSYLSSSVTKRRTKIHIKGRGLFGTWTTKSSDSNLILRLGIVSYSTSDSAFEGSQSINFGFGIGYDLFK